MEIPATSLIVQDPKTSAYSRIYLYAYCYELQQSYKTTFVLERQKWYIKDDWNNSIQFPGLFQGE